MSSVAGTGARLASFRNGSKRRGRDALLLRFCHILRKPGEGSQRLGILPDACASRRLIGENGRLSSQSCWGRAAAGDKLAGSSGETPGPGSIGVEIDMKLVKSLFLGSAAALVAVGAQAADLPVKKAAPVEYVRICSTYGEGFFYVPGTDSCLRVSGRLRVDVGYNEPLSRANDSIGVRVRGRVNFDHRTATAYGLLRTYVRYEIDRNSGFFFNGVNGTIATSPNLAQGFIQFGGLTAGRVTSFFANPDLPTTHMGTLRFDDAAGRRPLRLHLLVRQRLLGHDLGRGCAVAAQQHLRRDRAGRRVHGAARRRRRLLGAARLRRQPHPRRRG